MVRSEFLGAPPSGFGAPYPKTAVTSEARHMPGTLFIVGTPIGNLGDLTLRAIETLRQADRVFAEDTRRTRALLSHLEIHKKPLHRLDAHATPQQVHELAEHVE